jgi:hypothetical protein
MITPNNACSHAAWQNAHTMRSPRAASVTLRLNRHREPGRLRRPHRHNSAPERMVRPIRRSHPTSRRTAECRPPGRCLPRLCLHPAVEQHLRRSGALLFPRLPNLPLTHIERTSMTRPSSTAQATMPKASDAIVYAWCQLPACPETDRRVGNDTS